MKTRRIVTWLAVAALLTVSLAVPALAAGQSNTTQITGNVAPWVKQASYVGPTDPNASVTFSVNLKLRNEQTLDAYLRTAQTPGGGKSNHLTFDQFMAQYGPSAADYQAVQDWLTSQGFTIAGTVENRLFVKATGTVGQVQQAFGIQVNDYNLNGATFHSNSGDPKVPGNLGSVVDGVVGLDNADQYLPNAHFPAEAPQEADAVPCGSKGLTNHCYYKPAQIRHAYGVDQVAYDGTGKTIVIVDAYGSATAAADLDAFDAHYGLPPANLTIMGNNGTAYLPPANPHYANQQGWAGEIALDLQWAHAMAPGANLVLMASGNNQRDLDEAVNYAVVHSLGDVISLSWGEAEIFVSAAKTRGTERIFKQAAAQGISVQNSSGDSGDEFSSYGVITADYPTSSPYVTSVGGTSLFLNPDNSFAFETSWGTTLKKKWAGTSTWVDLGFVFGGGGGTSNIFGKPSWQTGLSGTMRSVPDISMVADPYTGVPVNIGGYYYIYGGTSLSSPLFSGVMALADQAAGYDLGQAAPLLYPLAGTSAIRDVTPRDTSSLVETFVRPSGNAYIVGFGHDSSLTVQNGWDNATGLGSPYVPALVQALAGH